MLGENTTDQSGSSVDNAGDVNGDGFGDLLIGAPFADPVSGTDAGKAYIYFGGAQVSRAGNAIIGSGTITGTVASEALVGSSGNDTFTGGGGVDRFFGGAGNDIIKLTASDITNLISRVTTTPKASINGGSGIDTIEVIGGTNLDTTRVAQDVISSIEQIDLHTDTAANTLTINAQDIANLAGFNLFNSTNGWLASVTTNNDAINRHQMVITGSSNDAVGLVAGAGWATEWDKLGYTLTHASHSGQIFDVYDHKTMAVELLIAQGVVVS